MRITTETAIGHMLFNTVEAAEALVSEMAEFADDGETFSVLPYQGHRFHVARFYNGEFEAYC